jgi:hypothetical protein
MCHGPALQPAVALHGLVFRIGPVAGRGAVSTFFRPSAITLTASLPLTNWAAAVVETNASATSANA